MHILVLRVTYKEDMKNIHMVEQQYINFVEKHNIEVPEPIIIEDYMKGAAKNERQWKEHYEIKGYKMLNIAPTGATGGGYNPFLPKLSKKHCLSLIDNCKNVKEYSKKYSREYRYIKKHNLEEYVFMKYKDKKKIVSINIINNTIIIHNNVISACKELNVNDWCIFKNLAGKFNTKTNLRFVRYQDWINNSKKILNEIKIEQESLLSKRIVMLTLEGKYLNIFNNTREAYNFINVYGKNGNIGYCCNGNVETAHGYKWMFKRDYDNLISSKRI